MPSRGPENKVAPSGAKAKPARQSATVAALGSAKKAVVASGKSELHKKSVDRTRNSLEIKVPIGVPALSQAALFDQAMELFHSRDFAAASKAFELAASGGTREIAHAARMHSNMCRQRLSGDTLTASSADEHYDLAIALMNRRELLTARKHLEAAIEINAKDDHLHYAMALLKGLDGDYSASAHSLAKAIDLDPKNRSAARSDPDFQPILKHAEFATVLTSQEDTFV